MDKMLLNKKIDTYKEEIYNRNCRNFISFTLGGMIITAAILVIGIILNGYTEFVIEYGCFFIYMLILFFVAKLCNKYKIRHIDIIYYIAITPIMAGGILMGTFLDPDQPAITVMILMCVITLFVIEKPLYNTAYLICIASIFAVCCYISKDRSQFSADMVDLIIYTCISIGVNYFMLKGHIESAENFCKLRYESERDALTGLYNRGTGENKVRCLIEKHASGAFMIMDIDNFKKINDTYGHQVGDESICELARILRSVFRLEDIVFRLGGDEFAVFVPGITEIELCEQRFSKIMESIKKIHTSDKECSVISVSIGCTIYRGERASFEDIYKVSDIKLYDIKKHEKGRAIVDYYQK